MGNLDEKALVLQDISTSSALVFCARSAHACVCLRVCTFTSHMKFGFKFSNLLGTVYKRGNLLFTPDGNSLLSPIGNKINVYDLANHTTHTLPVEAPSTIQAFTLSPDGSLLIAIDEDGNAVFVNYIRQCVLDNFRFSAKPRAVKFSPDGKYFAIAINRSVKVYTSPKRHKEFSSCMLFKQWTKHHDVITCLTWSPNSEMVVSGSKDGLLQMVSIKKGKKAYTLAGVRQPKGVFFDSTGSHLYAVSKGAKVFCAEEQPHKWAITKIHSLYTDAKAKNSTRVVSCSMSPAHNLLVVGDSRGKFTLVDLPLFNIVHSLHIASTSGKIATMDINKDGDWIAFGCPDLGQLIVWEWQSETYVLKQQGHAYDTNTISYSPDGQLIASGSDDNKLKIWNTTTGFCFVTFTEHTGPITQVQFSPKLGSHVVFSASVDGTVRAYDLLRYRNFRTLTAPSPTQFSCLAVDPSSEIVAAGSLDTFEVVVWSVQTGKVLDVLTGHTGPISAIAFNPTSQILATVSWDKFLIVWDIFEGKPHREPMFCSSDLVAVAFNPNGKEICTSGIDGQLTFWEIETGTITGTIDGQKDLDVGRLIKEARTAKNTPRGKYFTCISYTPDGSCMLAGGDSRMICMYELQQKVLLRKFQTTTNRSLDGMSAHLSSRRMTEFGSLDHIEADFGSDEEEDVSKRIDKSMPGATKGDLSDRSLIPMARTKAMSCSPTGRSWAAATTEGIIVYSLDHALLFDPLDLDLDITTTNIRACVRHREFLKALVMSFRLNEKNIITEVLEAIPSTEIQFVAYNFPLAYVKRLLDFLGVSMETTRHLEHHQLWMNHVLTGHGQYIKDNSHLLATQLRSILKSSSKWLKDLSKLSDDNLYTMDYYNVCPKERVAIDVSDMTLDESMGVDSKEVNDSDFASNWNSEEAGGVWKDEEDDGSDGEDIGSSSDDSSNYPTKASLLLKTKRK
eukprot:Phypoly_transcript_00323.p1 GENE.Phypoly_transcript_00323~~Phypoly_transcript_00323.p1  ORF type:complete len:955 (+),score=97.26 Phypoly_transcript_00323:2285-5149(+)